jgi:gamma-glutamylcyclotransferase (GGCT)/AIG2-like uncharacterized protein YtfP
MTPRPPEQTLYFAYGSNLSLARMARRCPAARPLWTARVPDWCLRFERVATIAPTPGAMVPGAVYSLTRVCEAALDRIEGVEEGRYRRHALRIAGPDGQAAQVLTYVKIDARRGPPTPEYLGHLETGYRDWRLDPAPLLTALRQADAGVEPGLPAPGRAG